MAEVKWTARRVSDGVLVDVTGDTEGVPAVAPTPNALEGGGGAGTPLSFDNTIDPPTDITSLVAAGGSVVGSEATLRGKDFYAQDTDPGAVGAGSVWKDTFEPSTPRWWLRNLANDGWEPNFMPDVYEAGDENAIVGPKATTDGIGTAFSGPESTANGTGVADAVSRATATDSLGAGGVAESGANATAVDGSANTRLIATTTGTGDVNGEALDTVAAVRATASGSGDANAFSIADANSGNSLAGGKATSTTGTATARLTATGSGGTAGVVAVATDLGDVAMGFFNATPVSRPLIGAVPTEQEIVDALVALGLVTQEP